MDAPETQVDADIRAAGLRRTAQRVAVLSALRAEPSHLLVDEVVDRVRERLGTVSTQAVYDVLGALTDAGLVRRIEPAGSPARYEAGTDHDHHHLVCRRCGAVADVDPAAGPAEADALRPSTTHGFVVDRAEVIFWGTCPACQQS
ncbi:MAG: Fur family transcriptional regulator [Acidimicrobiales bacterium]